MSIIKHLLPSFVTDRYLDLKRRLDKLELGVRCLEAAMDGFIVNPKYVPGEEASFNGQRHRKRIFAEIMAAIPVDAIVETGTWLGDTTGHMAETARRPVYSCEVNRRFHSLAKMRLAGLKEIHLEAGDSRGLLQKLASSTEVAGKRIFFYLDAHWYDDLPLGEEIEIIAAHWNSFVIMIDDFKVPDDPGYSYDDYGNGKALALELIKPSIGKHSLAVYFPAARSGEETGTRRGCVVLAPKGELSEKLSQAKSLRGWDFRESSD
jgi:hypothetical protein